MGTEQVWVRRPSLVWRKVGEEAVILDPNERVLRGLNPSGWHVWELLDGDHTVAQIGRSLAEHFQIPLARATEDLARLLGELERAQLIERRT